MSSSSLSFQLFTVAFLLDHGYEIDDLRGHEARVAAMQHYWSRFSVVYDYGSTGGRNAYWWDREDGWLPVSLLPL